MQNMILANGEPTMQMAEVGRELDKSPSTVIRWAMTGIRCRDGRRVRLEHVRVGRELRTSRAAMSRFMAALSEVPGDEKEVPTAAARRKASEVANAELQRMGC